MTFAYVTNTARSSRWKTKKVMNLKKAIVHSLNIMNTF